MIKKIPFHIQNDQYPFINKILFSPIKRSLQKTHKTFCDIGNLKMVRIPKDREI